MNKTITIYELLGLVKDGKAPEKIIFDTEKYIWEKEVKEYRRYPYDNNLYYSLWSDYDLTKCLNDTVEIIEDNDKLEDRFEFTVSGGIWSTKQASELIDNLDKLEKRIIDHINKMEAENGRER